LHRKPNQFNWLKCQIRLLCRYSAAGTVAWAFSLATQVLLVEKAGMTPAAAYGPQFAAGLLLYYFMLRKLVWTSGCYSWRVHMKKLGSVKAAQAVAGFGAFQALLAAGSGYLLATVVSTLVVGLVFYLVTKRKVFTDEVTA
jgi:putative flippase GtrA